MGLNNKPLEVNSVPRASEIFVLSHVDSYGYL